MTSTETAVYLDDDRPAVEHLTLDAPAETLAASENAGRREVAGLALPYGEKLDRPSWQHDTRWMEFAPGSAVVRDNAKLYFGHDHLTRALPVGKVTAHEETDAGPRITGRLSQTPKADEVYTLAQDGVLDRFSIGFWPVRYEIRDADTPDATLLYLEVDVFEVSIVPDPAYDSAVIDSVLDNRTDTRNPQQKEQKLMKCDKCDQVHAAGVTECQKPTETFASAEAVQTLSENVEQLGRQIATLGAGGQSAGDDLRDAPGDSYGEFLQLVASGDEAAREFLAFAGGDIGDLGDQVRDAWVGDLYRQITERRTVLNLFDSSPLPATGMNVEYGRVDAASDTIAVAEQLAEADELAYGKITFHTDTAPVKTYGGWSEMSRQAVERSGVAVVEKFFSALVNRYAKVTETVARTKAVDPANAHELTDAVPDLSTSDGWIDFVADAAFFLDYNGLPLEFLLVGRDVFKDLAKLRDGNNADAPRLLDRRSGTVNITGLNGQVFNLPVIPVKGAAGLVRACHSSAIRTFEAGGAPFRLQDDDITNLTKAMSIYGYMATAVQDTKAIVRPNDGV